MRGKAGAEFGSGGFFIEALRGRTAAIVDRQLLWHEAIEGVLRRLGITVVGRGASSADAVGLVRRHTPDLLVMELWDDSEPDGITCLRQARELLPGLRVVALSEDRRQGPISAALAAGAAAYVVKSAHPDDLAAAVRQAFQHSIFLANGHAVVPASHERAEPTREGELPELTRRELELLPLVAEGYSNAQLASMLWVTEQTVKFHLSNIYRKLHVSNRTEASRWAQRYRSAVTYGGRGAHDDAPRGLPAFVPVASPARSEHDDKPRDRRKVAAVEGALAQSRDSAVRSR